MRTTCVRLASWLALLLVATGCGRTLSANNAATPGPRIVLIIRHGEKPPEGQKNPDLSEHGFARADALAKAIPEHFPKPDYLIATKRSKGSNRPVETITPLSRALNEPIESSFKDDAFDQVANDVLTNPKYAGKVVLIAWHHGKIPALATALRAKNVPEKWKASVFDRVWEIDYDHGAAKFKDLPEHALPGDSDK